MWIMTVTLFSSSVEENQGRSDRTPLPPSACGQGKMGGCSMSSFCMIHHEKEASYLLKKRITSTLSDIRHNIIFIPLS